jgi:hypothetical protein
MIGNTLSHYQISAELGRGGMGIVYRATDTRLNRQVALKVLPAAALSSKEDRARFFREAQAAAQLQHPNIATVFEIDEAMILDAEGNEVHVEDGPRPFIAMELIEGKTLREYIEEGPLKLAEAVQLAAELAEALKAAHAKNIVHRDIKSANVMITVEGVAKVLDFGLAKTNASTLLTRMGSTLGTVAYMSPEQARGEEVDGRSDLYSLGTVLYEMVAGHLPFDGEYEQAVVYAILNEDAEALTAIRSDVPMQLEWIVHKLLSKQADYRYQTAADLIADLKTIEIGGSAHTRRAVPISKVQTGNGAGQRSRVLQSLQVTAPVFVLAIIVAWLAFGRGEADDSRRPVIQTTLDVTANTQPLFTFDVSPDQTLLAYSDREVVRVLRLDDHEEWAVPESDLVERLVFSADGKWLFLERPGSVWRTPIRGGSPLKLVDAEARFTTVNVAGPDAIVYESGGDVWRLNLISGETHLAIPFDSTSRYDDPHLTRDRRSLLVRTLRQGQPEKLRVFDFPDGILRGEFPLEGSFPFYWDEGYLFYRAGGRMMMQPVDLDDVSLLGQAVPVGDYWSRAFRITRDGHLFAAPPALLAGGGFSTRYIHYVDWSGNDRRLPPQPASYGAFDLHANGDEVAIEINSGDVDIWIVDVRSGVRNRLTSAGESRDPHWINGTDSLLYVHSTSRGFPELRVRAADSSSTERTIYRRNRGRILSPRPDGAMRRVIFATADSASQDLDLWELDVLSGVARPVIAGAGAQDNASYSPDGRFVTYQSPSSAFEDHVWIESSSYSGARWDLSPGGGSDPRWSPDGKAVFYRSGTRLMRVGVVEGAEGVSITEPDTVYQAPERLLDYDLHDDGSGFLVVESIPDVPAVAEGESDGAIRVIYNWATTLEQMAPRVK